MPTSLQFGTTISIRVPSEDRQLIDQAAKAVGKSRTEFVLGAARIAAREALLDQTYFELDDETFNTLLSILDSPPEPTQALRDLMAGRMSSDHR